MVLFKKLRVQPKASERLTQAAWVVPALSRKCCKARLYHGTDTGSGFGPTVPAEAAGPVPEGHHEADAGGSC